MVLKIVRIVNIIFDIIYDFLDGKDFSKVYWLFCNDYQKKSSNMLKL